MDSQVISHHFSGKSPNKVCVGWEIGTNNTEKYHLIFKWIIIKITLKIYKYPQKNSKLPLLKYIGKLPYTLEKNTMA
jgi:hypothetical protein